MIDKKEMAKVLKKAKRIQKNIVELNLLISSIDDLSYSMSPGPFWIDTDIIPELKEMFGGEIYRHRFFDDGTFSADLDIDGVRFSSDFINMKEWERYG